MRSYEILTKKNEKNDHDDDDYLLPTYPTICFEFFRRPMSNEQEIDAYFV